MMQLSSFSLRAILFAASIAVSSTLFAQQEDPAARLDRATALTALGSVDQKPWHLKLDVTVYDDAGKNPSAGSIEMWKSGEDSRQVFTFGTAVLTRIQHGREIYREGTTDPVSYRATEILEQILHPGPVPEDQTSSKPTMQVHKFGKIALDCIMLSQSVKDEDKLPLGLYPTFCLNQGTDIIRSSYNFGSRTVILNGLGAFLDHKVATQMDILSNSSLVATAKVTALSTYAPDPAQFATTPEMQHAYADAARVSGGVIAGNILTKAQPVYPDSARQNHVTGTVVLHALIGRDGHVYALRPISSPDPDLTISAIAAVRQWRYKPYLLNGVPTEIDTTIMVNYNIN